MMAAGARPRGARLILLGAALATAGALYAGGVNPAVSQTTVLDARLVADAPGLDPGAGVWDRAPAVELPMTAQGVTYPFGGGSVPLMDVRAMHDGDTLFIRMQWEDPSPEDGTARAEDFSDAVAVQFPAESASSVPAICMGQADDGVNIWQWRADTQAGVPQVARGLHSDAYVDLYASTDQLWYPGREVNNIISGPDGPVVEDLVAEGFGTLTPAADQSVAGEGRWDDGRWSVVVARPLEGADDSRPTFETGAPIDTAFAVWNGAEGDRNGQKSVTDYVRLEATTESLPPAGFDEGVVVAIAVGVVGLVGGLAVWSRVRPGRP